MNSSDGGSATDLGLAWVEPGEVSINPRQPRTVFDEDQLAELAASIQEVGLLQPIVVRRTDAGLQLIAGERRLRACVLAGLGRIPALVRDTADSEMLREALLENLQRADLNAIEEAAAYQALITEHGYSHEVLAERVGRSRPHITNSLRLLRLPAGVARRLAAGVISAGHARALLGLPDPGSMEELAARIVAEGLSVRSVEEIVALGVAPQRRPRTRRPGAGPAADLEEVAEGLAARLDTRVSVTMGHNSKGRVTIEFAGRDDLERIMALLADRTGVNHSESDS